MGSSDLGLTSDVQALVGSCNLDVSKAIVELLVCASLVAFPNLELASVLPVAILDVETESPVVDFERAGDGGWVRPSAVTVRNLSEVAARCEDDGGTVSVGLCGQTETVYNSELTNSHGEGEAFRYERTRSSIRVGGNESVARPLRSSGLSHPILVRAAGARPELQLCSIAGVPIGEIDTLVVASGPRPVVVVEQLILASSAAIPDLKLHAVCVTTIDDVETLSRKEYFVSD